MSGSRSGVCCSATELRNLLQQYGQIRPAETHRRRGDAVMPDVRWHMFVMRKGRSQCRIVRMGEIIIPKQPVFAPARSVPIRGDETCFEINFLSNPQPDPVPEEHFPFRNARVRTVRSYRDANRLSMSPLTRLPAPATLLRLGAGFRNRSGKRIVRESLGSSRRADLGRASGERRCVVLLRRQRRCPTILRRVAAAPFSATPDRRGHGGTQDTGKRAAGFGDVAGG